MKPVDAAIGGKRTAAPPILDLLGDKASRQAAARYWLRDTATGLLNLTIHNALRLLPTSTCSGFGALHARFCPYRYPQDDARARRLWARLRPQESSPAELDAAMRRLWRNVARTIAEYSVIHRFWSEGRIQVEGVEHLTAARAAGKPILLASLHLGNWETVGATVSALGYAIAGTYEPPENRFEHMIANQVRTRYGARIVYPDRSGGRAALRHMTKDNQIIIFFVDEMFQRTVAAVETGDAQEIKGNIGNVPRLARLANAEIMLIYCTRLGDEARFKVTISPPVPQVRTPDSRADLAANVAAIDRAVAPIVERNLDQWFYVLSVEDDAPQPA